jgi:phosphate transport system permease protein
MQDIPTVLARRRRQDFLFNLLGIVCTLVGVVTLVILLIDLAMSGLSRIDGQFMTSFPSRLAARAGILSAWVGTLVVMLVTALTAVPLGVAAGVYLEEYGRKNWLTSLIEINISNLAGVPSIIYGLMALGLFVYQFHLGHSILSAGLTLACLILPIVIVATREALRAIPGGIREASYALGATKWQTDWHHLMP